jgi:hypothetical protein
MRNRNFIILKKNHGYINLSNAALNFFSQKKTPNPTPGALM